MKYPAKAGHYGRWTRRRSDSAVRPGFTISNADTVSFAIVFHDVDVAFNGTDDVLSNTLDLPVDATRAQQLDAMKDSVVAKPAYAGRFHQ